MGGHLHLRHKNHAWLGSHLTYIYNHFIGISRDDYLKIIKINPDF